MATFQGPPGVPSFSRPRPSVPGGARRTAPSAPRPAPPRPRSTPTPAPRRTAPARPRNTHPEVAIPGHPRTGIPVLLLAALALLALAAVGGAQVLQSSDTATVGYQLAALEEERRLLSAEIRVAEADVARLSRRDEIRQIAVDRLGMVEATDTISIAVSADVPDVVPLPERYIEPVPAFEPRQSSWWERLSGFLPGAQ